MSSKQKLAVVKKCDPNAEFEMLLRQTAEYLKQGRPQIVRKTQPTRHVRLA